MGTNVDYDSYNSSPSHIIDNYTMVEFVSVPQEFDIDNYLTFHEQMGLFDIKGIHLKQLKHIAEAIKYSPVVALMNNSVLEPVVGFYLLSILDELNLILKSIPNPLRRSRVEYKTFIEDYTENKDQGVFSYVREQEVKFINIIIVNIFPMMSEDVISEAAKNSRDIQKYQDEFDEKLKGIENLD